MKFYCHTIFILGWVFLNLTMYYFVNKEVECGETDQDNESLKNLKEIKDICNQNMQ